MVERDKKGLWQKGSSGNPSGRPKVVSEIAELARQYTNLAITTLAEIAGDANAKQAARVAAANSLLDRGYGRAPQSLEVKGDVGGWTVNLLTTNPKKDENA